MSAETDFAVKWTEARVLAHDLATALRALLAKLDALGTIHTPTADAAREVLARYDAAENPPRAPDSTQGGRR